MTGWLARASILLRFARAMLAYRLAPKRPFRELLDDKGYLRRPMSFVQIGAHTGRENDWVNELVKEFGWRGVAVEPVPALFEELKRTYASVDGMRVEQAAIGLEDGAAEFFLLEPTAKSRFASQVGSLKAEHVVRHAFFLEGSAGATTSIKVPCLTFTSLLRKHGIDSPEAVFIDAEGFDFVILSQIDLRPERLRVVLYEHLHLTRSERARSRRLLEHAGFRIWTLFDSYLAIR